MSFLRFSPPPLTRLFQIAALAATALTAHAQLPSTADLGLWLDASDIDADGNPDSIVHGTTITNWQDKSGNNHHADVVQDNPSYIASGPNGKPVVNFDGNDQISLSDDLRNFLTDADGSYSLFTVARYSGGARNRVISVDSGHNWLFGFHGGQTTRWHADGWITLDSPASGDDAWHLHSGLMDGAPADPQGLFYRDGGLRTDITSGNVNITGRNGHNNFNNYAPDRLALGGWNVSSEFSTCEVAEVILYDRLLSDSERLEVEEYLNCKYGLGPQVAAQDDASSTDEDTVATEVDLPLTAVGSFAKAADLDFSGTFPYAVNAHGPGGFSIGDANFTADSAAGVTLSSTHEILFWDTPPILGNTTDDDNLENVMQSIRWSQSPNSVTVDLDSLNTGSLYKLQLLFLERTSDRGFDVEIEGQQAVDDFNPGTVGEIDFFPAVITHTFVAGDTTLNIELNGVDTPFPDKSPILQGLTLELLPPTTFGLLANDNVGDATVIDSSATSALGASVSVNSNGSFIYDPTSAPGVQALGPGATADDTFTYTISKDPPPTALGGVVADLALWLDANDIDADGFKDSVPDGSTVTNWQDKSGNDRDANGVLGTPFYVRNSTANRTGAPAVGFSTAGGADQLFTSYNFDNLGANYTIFAVSRYSGGANARVVTSKTRNWLYGHHGNRDDRWFAEGWIEMGDAITDTNMHLYSGVIGPDVNGNAGDPGADFWKDGEQLEDDNQGSHNTAYKPGAIALGAWTGGGEASNAEVSEVIIYNRALSDAERRAVEAYLYAKYFGAGTSTATATVSVTGIDDPLVAQNDDYCTDSDTALPPAELTSLLELNALGTGEYTVTADGDTFDAHVDHDGTSGWLLVGRGRESWLFDNDAATGQQTANDVKDNLGTPAAFAPADFRDDIINDLLNGAGVDLTDVEIRLKRAEDPGGTAYQEVRWRPQTQSVWTWDFDDPGYTVEQEVVSGTGAGSVTTDITRDTEPPNDERRVFTWPWGGHNNQQGFSYGQNVSNGANNATSFLWENTNENHAIPYTEVYIRVPSAPAGTPPASLLANDSDPDNEFFVSAFDTTGTLGLVNVPTGIPAGDGSFTYDPNGAFDGLIPGDMATDTFEYTVTTIEPASARFVRVENNGTGTRRMDIGEIEVFAPGVTPAVDNTGGSGALNPSTDLATTAKGASLHSKGATSGFSQPHGGDDDPRLIDGAETTGGNTWSSNGVGNFVVIDLGSTQAIGSVRVHQRNDGCCQDRLQDFTVSLLADSGGSPGAVMQSGVFATQPADNGFGEPPLGPLLLGESQTATATVTIKGVNDPPAVDPTPIPDEMIFTSNPTLDIDLFDHFEDPDSNHDDTDLTYAVTMNTNGTLIQTGTISSLTGILTLTTPCDIIGTADITVEATDPGGLTVSDTFTVTVKDDVAPSVITPGLVKVTAPDGQTSAQVFFLVGGLDKVDGNSVTIVCTPPSGSVFQWGSTTVNCTATDQTGNVGVGSFTVTVKLPDDVMLASVSVGDAADGAGAVGDGTYNQIDGAHLTANGKLLVAAEVDLNKGLWSGDVTGLSLVGMGPITLPPGGGGNPLFAFDRAAIGEDGNSAFHARLDGGGEGRWTSSGGTLADAAVVGGPVPDVPGATFFKLPIKGWALNNVGEYFFLGQMDKAAAGINEANNQGIFSNTGGLLIREGSLAPEIGGGATYTAFENQIGANDSGEVAFSSALRLGGVVNGGDNRAVFCGDPSSPDVVARRGNVAPGTTADEFDIFWDVGLNAAGECAFLSRLRDGSVTPDNNTGVWSDGGGTLALVAREGDAAPDFGAATTVFDSFSAVQITNDGAVVFRARVRDAAVPLSAREDDAIYIYQPGTGLSLVAREGGVAPETSSTYINLTGLSVHPGGELGFNGVLKRGVGGVTRRNEHGVWVLDFSGGAISDPALLVRADDPITVGGEEETVHRAFITGGEDGGTAGRSSGVACGNVAVVVNYDGNRATTVFVMGVPDPAAP